MSKKELPFKRNISQNRSARFEYHIESTLEAGIVLTGPEAKSIRIFGANINDSYADVYNGELFMLNMHIKEYSKANKFSEFESRRPRKLLLHKKEIRKMIGLVQKKGFTLVPLNLYYNNKNMVKVELAVVKGKKLYDKREDKKQKDIARQTAREIS